MLKNQNTKNGAEKVTTQGIRVIYLYFSGNVR